MTILQEIQTWSESLPDWQSDAIFRLFTKQNLEQDDIEDLYALLKSEHGIPDPEERKASRFLADHISATTPKDIRIELLGIKNLIHVNAIANDQRLGFSPKGMTVVYGDNGAGKSGYSRVLKRACRARDQSEQIFPNVTLPEEGRGIAEATFEININGEYREEKWIDGNPAHETLSALGIFDHRCARAYLDDENDFSYVPYGLDILEGLANVCRQLKLKIEQELAQNIPDITQFDELCGDTTIGNLIENLSENTDPADVEILASIKPEDTKRRDILERSLKIENPKEKAEILRMRSQRVTRVANNTREKLATISDTNLIYFADLDHNYLVAQAAADLAAKNFYDSGDLLPGTGGDAWKILFEAARKFSEEAYPGEPFPYIENGARCPLCQQKLEDGALRFQQFDEYVQQEIETTAQISRKRIDEIKAIFFAQNMSIDLDDETFSEISTYDKSLAQECRSFEVELDHRFKKIISAFSSHNWTDVPNLQINPLDKLESLATLLNIESDVLEKATDKSSYEGMQSQFHELDTKIHFSHRKTAVVKTINQMKFQSKLNQCLSAVRTNGISLKASEISERVISDKLAEALNGEFEKLGVGHLKTSIKKSRTERGKTLYRLKLNLSYTCNPCDILSEGEQRAIAIASFLAEVNINDGSGGIVFDDPVSSLDHKRRDRVARRLAQEAEKRQVVVFTHDLYFLFVLMEESQRMKVPFETHHLVTRFQRFGIPEDGSPFFGMSTLDRVKSLKDRQQRIAKVHRNGDDSECRRQIKEAYGDLRSTWERAVEEVLFQNVVMRFQSAIHTVQLKNVSVEISDYEQIEQGMSKCSKVTGAHDTATAIGNNVPDPDELLADITALDNWRLLVVERSKELRKQRKS